MLQGVDRVLLRVQSLDSAVAYYRDTLGMTLLRQEKRVAAFALGPPPSQAELVLHDSPDLPSQGIYFRVADARAIYRDREKLKLKFAIPPGTVTRGHTAQVRDPFGNVLLLLDRTKEVPGGPSAAGDGGAIESAAPAGGGLFAGVEQKLSPKRDALIAAYEAVSRTADDLPYTHHFESLHDAYRKAFESAKPSREETWRHLLNVRKAGKLPKLGEARSHPPDATAEERSLLKELLADNIGKRDRLPYTATFDTLVALFNRDSKRHPPLTPHQLWRLVATLAK